MKKQLLLTIAGCLSGLLMTAQSLVNTTWAYYYPGETLFRYMYFTDDTLHWSQDNVTYTAHSVIAFSGDAMQINDLLGADMACAVTDIGQYTFEIVNDTLEFALVSDPCGPRASTLDGGFGLQLFSGIDGPMLDPVVTVFPNPTTDGLFHMRLVGNSSTYRYLSVCTLSGQMLQQRSLPNSYIIDQDIELGDQADGMYLLVLEGDKHTHTIKLIVRR